MSETDDLARRFFALWRDYLTALGADPKTAAPCAAGSIRGRVRPP